MTPVYFPAISVVPLIRTSSRTLIISRGGRELLAGVTAPRGNREVAASISIPRRTRN